MEDEQCSGCGLSLNETLNPENERKYLTTPVICHACATKGLAAEAFHEGGDSDYAKAGVLFPVEKDDI